MAWVYLLEGQTGRRYLGSTEDLKHRVGQHQAGRVYTTKRLGLPLRLVGAVAASDMENARQWERMLKGWKNRERVERWFQRNTVGG